MNYAEHKYPDRAKLTPKEKGAKAAREARLPVEQRMAMRTDKNGPNGCHQWTGAITWQGYGQIGWKGKMLRAHRVAWELAGRELPQRPMVLDHICKNTLCVNPDHMRVVHEHDNWVKYSDSVFAKNAKKTHCAACNNPLSGENLALVPAIVRGREKRYRYCLTCYPSNWRHAVIPRPRPPRSKVKPGDPDYQPKQGT